MQLGEYEARYEATLADRIRASGAHDLLIKHLKKPSRAQAFDRSTCNCCGGSGFSIATVAVLAFAGGYVQWRAQRSFLLGLSDRRRSVLFA